MPSRTERVPARNRTVVAALGLGSAFACACSLAFSLDGLTAGDGGQDATVDDGGPEGTVGSDAADGAAADVLTDTSHYDETPFVPDAGCVESGAACVAVPPSGWQGPFLVYDGNQANAPGCAPPTPNVLLNAHADMNAAQPAQCSACGCAPPTGGACATSYTYWGGCTPCDAAANGANAGDCLNSTLFDCTGAYTPMALIAPLGASGGSCAPTPQNPTVPPLTWMRFQLGCTTGGLVQADCAHGEVCAPLGSTPFETKACILQLGDLACPGQPYSSKRLVYAGASDTRGCTSCACAPATGQTCATQVSSFEYSNCSGTVTQMAAPGCFAEPALSVAAIGSPEGGAYVDGGAPTGTATPSQEVTVCCIP